MLILSLLLAQALFPPIASEDLTNSNRGLSELIAEKRQACEEVGGELAIDEDAVRSIIDFNRDGVVDPIVSEAGFACSASASLFRGGTGGSMIHVLVSNADDDYNRFDLVGYGYQLVVWGDLPIIVVPSHFSACGLHSPSSCVVSFTYSDGRFVAPGKNIAPVQHDPNPKG